MKIKPLGNQTYFKNNNKIKLSSNTTDSITQNSYTYSQNTKDKTFTQTPYSNSIHYTNKSPRIAFCSRMIGVHSMYGYPMYEEEANNPSIVYCPEEGYGEEIEFRLKDKVEELISKRQLDEAISLLDSDKDSSDCGKQITKIAEKLIEDGKLDEAIQKITYKNFKAGDDLIARELVRNGRSDEASKINSTATIQELIAIGRLDQLVSLHGEGKLPINNGRSIKVGDITELLGKNGSFEELAERKRVEASKSAKGVHDFEEWYERVIGAIFTLGYTEINNIISRNRDRKRELYCANFALMEDRKKLIKDIDFAIKGNTQSSETAYEQAKRIQTRETKEEAVKSQIQTKFLEFIKMDQDGKPVSEFPNCIMLVGKNIPYMQTLIDWTAENADCNYVKIPYNMDNSALQETLGEKLDEAEENYHNTGTRTIIYVNGMEKLLSPTKNTDGNIACMKEMMNTADKNYHSTIIFTAKDPSKLDPGTMVSHRVGLSIDVPVSFEETAI